MNKLGDVEMKNPANGKPAPNTVTWDDSSWSAIFLENNMPQSLAKVYLPVVFSTKNRETVLTNGWRDELFQVLGGTTNNLGCQSMIVGGVTDHVHLLFQLGWRVTLADTIGKIKSTSSLWVNQTRGLLAPFHWQSGYAAFSVSQSNVEAVREYIRRQPEHHRKQSFQDEL